LALSTPRNTLGSLQERDIFTRGDLKIPRKKALFSVISILTPTPLWLRVLLPGQHVWMDSRKSTLLSPAAARATAGGETVDLYKNIAVLMPANLEFTLKNTATSPWRCMWSMKPTPPGFRPNSNMLVRDENKLSHHLKATASGPPL